MKTILIFILPPLAVFLGIYWYLNKAVTPDPDYNTVYPNSYNENKFLDLKVGMTRQQIENAIGKPFEVLKPKNIHKIIYSNQRVFIDHGEGVHNLDHVPEMKFMVCNFNQSEVCIKVKNYDFILEVQKNSLLHCTYNDIVSKYGRPLQEVKCYTRDSIMIYSTIKEGGYTGKSPIINIRRLAIGPDNKLVKSIIGVDSPYNKYYGLCE